MKGLPIGVGRQNTQTCRRRSREGEGVGGRRGVGREGRRESETGA